MRTRKAKHQDAILRFLKQEGRAGAAEIQKGIGMKRGNIYQVMKLLVQKGLVTHLPGTRKYVLANETVDKRMPLFREHSQPTPPPAPNPLIAVYSREIQFVEDGIDSLMITKNYLQRRVEQLKQEDARRA